MSRTCGAAFDSADVADVIILAGAHPRLVLDAPSRRYAPCAGVGAAVVARQVRAARHIRVSLRRHALRRHWRKSGGCLRLALARFNVVVAWPCPGFFFVRTLDVGAGSAAAIVDATS